MPHLLPSDAAQQQQSLPPAPVKSECSPVTFTLDLDGDRIPDRLTFVPHPLNGPQDECFVEITGTLSGHGEFSHTFPEPTGTIQFSDLPLQNLLPSEHYCLYEFWPGVHLLFCEYGASGGYWGSLEVYAIGGSGAFPYLLLDECEWKIYRKSDSGPWLLRSAAVHEVTSDPDAPGSGNLVYYYTPTRVYDLLEVPVLNEAETRRLTIEDCGDYAGPEYRRDVLRIQTTDGKVFLRRYDHPVKL